MREILLLEQTTIDKIAAGEVVERPRSIVKELCENAIDAGASALTIEIRDGGISMIRVTDNGMGIDPKQVRTAFLRHATSKIRKVDELTTIRSFGFRGEALSSIAAVSRVEMITKTRENLTGIRYKTEGGIECLFEEIGAPEGTTILVRDLFFNTPARRKFLKSPQTEAGYIGEFAERLALSHPEISLKYMVNGGLKLATSGSGSQKDVIYQVFGRETHTNLIPIDQKDERSGMHLSGFIGKPVIARKTRACEILFVNGRLVNNSIVSKALEEGCEAYLMQHRFPFAILSLELDGASVDINVHPAKAQVRFSDGPGVFSFVKHAVQEAFINRELIVETTLSGKNAGNRSNDSSESLSDSADGSVSESEKNPPDLSAQCTALQDLNAKDTALQDQSMQKKAAQDIPEPFEKLRREHQASFLTGSGNAVQSSTPYSRKYLQTPQTASSAKTQKDEINRSAKQEQIDRSNRFLRETACAESSFAAEKQVNEYFIPEDPKGVQLSFLSEEAKPHHKMIGQLFDTYWLIEYDMQLYIIDQHAAHEKVMYEKLISQFREKKITSQELLPSLVISLTLAEEATLLENMALFREAGFVIDPFGDHDYVISAVPTDLFGLTEKEFFLEMLDDLSGDSGNCTQETVTSRLASMACKAAVKGNARMTQTEADELITRLLSLDNPYHCPHGRPTIISMSKTEIEKKFRRIL